MVMKPGAITPGTSGRVLAFDCSGASCSAAVLVDGVLKADRFAAMERGQAEVLVPMIQSAMADSGLDFADLDLIATTVGPGSFTGIRLGLAAAEGLALATGKPILALTSFEAHLAGLAPERRRDRPVAIVIDSRRGPVFLQIFGPDGAPLGEPAQIEPADLPTLLPAGPVAIGGDGLALLGDPTPPDRIRAADLARLAAGFGTQEPHPVPAHPLYLRPPDVTQPRPRAP
jgi:tRNA threonylcarbamoyladenosine biosynthesis protein TsaB